MLEIEAAGDLLAGLVQRVVELLLIDFARRRRTSNLQPFCVLGQGKRALDDRPGAPSGPRLFPLTATSTPPALPARTVATRRGTSCRSRPGRSPRRPTSRRPRRAATRLRERVGPEQRRPSRRRPGLGGRIAGVRPRRRGGWPAAAVGFARRRCRRRRPRRTGRTADEGDEQQGRRPPSDPDQRRRPGARSSKILGLSYGTRRRPAAAAAMRSTCR